MKNEKSKVVPLELAIKELAVAMEEAFEIGKKQGAEKKEKEMLRFAEWWRDHHSLAMSTEEAYEYWSSQDKDESNPNRKYL